MSELAFIPLGVGDAFSALWYSSALAIEYGDRRLLVDCPHPIRKILREASETSVAMDVGDFDAILLTHLHADHASGLEGFGYFSHFVLGHKARIITHPAVRERLWCGHLAAGMEHLMHGPEAEAEEMSLADYFELSCLEEGSSLEVGPFRVECRRTIHHVPTIALRIHAGGRSLGLSADTAFDPGLIAWLDECDSIVHETNYGIHTPYEKLAALPEALRDKMRLIHYPDDFDIEGSTIECLRQGRRYVV